MAMTAADMLKMKDSFVTVDDYHKDKESVEKRFNIVEGRVKCAEDSQARNDLIVVRIDTQLKILLWLTSIIGVAVIGYIVKMVFA